MTAGELETLLRAWGYRYGERAPTVREAQELSEHVRAPDIHPLAVAMRFAPGKKVRRLDVALRRMIRKGERSWSRDPIVCTETRSGGGGGDRRPLDQSAQRVQRWVVELRLDDPERGAVITMQYLRRGSQAEKAERMTKEGHEMSLRTYRERLASAKGWLEAKLSEKKAA